MSEQLQNEIRSTRPAAPDALRERVRALAEQEPAREPFLARFQRRQLVLLAPATLVVALVAAGVIGLTRDDVSGDETLASVGATTVAESYDSAAGASAAPVEGRLRQQPLLPASAADSAVGSAPALAPVPGQLQRYEAELRLRVDDVEALSSATKRAQRIALQHSGTIASLQYDAPAEGIGAAQITLRIPTARVQSAMTQLSQLGTILGQRYGIDDLQVQADTLQTQIEATQRQIAQLVARLESTTLPAEERVVLQSRLGNARQKLAGLREGLRGTNVEARTATIYLSLTTEEVQPAAEDTSRVDDVKDVLAWEGIALLYALVIAGPFLLVGVLTWLAFHHRRRREEARLLAK